MPSIDAISERIRLEQRIASLESVFENFEDALAEFAQLADEWKAVGGKKGAPTERFASDTDERKVIALETSFRSQLDLYQYGEPRSQDRKPISRKTMSQKLPA